MSKQLGFYYNMADCYGCQTCEVACKSEQATATSVCWRNVRHFYSDHPVAHATLSMSCNHCENPECMNNCPTGAYRKLDNGIVYQDHDKCIGCKMCIMACPYNAPQYDPEEGRTSKCSFCRERIEAGLNPACVDACPGGNIEFGDLDELRAKYPGVQVVSGMPKQNITKPSIIIKPAAMFRD